MADDAYHPLTGIRFVGDLSLEDASVLVEVAKGCPRILEFGAGGSTQIFAQCARDAVHSVETDPHWISKTKENLGELGVLNRVTFFSYGDCPDGNYDLVFVDGIPPMRLDFAKAMWPRLNTTGIMIFHDTRRFEYFREAAWIMQMHFNEIGRVEINYKNSNLTLIHKNPPKVYVNWNETEGKPAWAYAKADRPKGEELWQIGN